jgi:ABC-2 type transport system ATP-binding protein
MEQNEWVVETTGLSKTYGRRAKQINALQGVSIKVAAGSIYSLLGANGAGKTTFVKCLLGIVYPTGGTGTILNFPLGSIDSKKSIGYLPENHRYPSYLTGHQTLDYFARLSNVPGDLRKKRIGESLELVGMTKWSSTKVGKYSKGMMQRLGLAQAIVNDPQLIMLDEPTDGVDPIGRKEVRDILFELRNRGKTVFLNSHLLSEIETVSDRVAILNRGKLIREGTVDELTASHGAHEIVVVEEDRQHAATLLGVPLDGEAFRTAFESSIELNKAIDKLRSSQVQILRIAPIRSSLEEYFIQTVKEDTK